MVNVREPLSDYTAADPFMTYDGGTGYYYLLPTKSDRLEIFRSRHAGNILGDAESAVVFRANGEENGIFGAVWAPEMHKAPDGKWYIYTSGLTDPGDRKSLRLFVLQSKSADPFDGFRFIGLLDKDLYAIDPTVLTLPDGRQVMCYSRVLYTYAGQVLEIAEMVNPYTLGEKRTVIASPEYPWETLPPFCGSKSINEGPFFAENGGRLFIFYSGNGAYFDDYCLGALEYTGGDILSSGAWRKLPKPFLTQGNGVYGPGHASFFRSPDGSELWCAYHGLHEHNYDEHLAPRLLHLQKVEFDGEGYPVPARPLPNGSVLPAPSGEPD